MLPIVATVASPMPESAAKIAQANTVIIPSAPVLCPNNSRPRLTSFVDIQPSGIKSLARVKNRTASRVYGLAEVTYVLAIKDNSTRSVVIIAAIEHIPSENPIGM